MSQISYNEKVVNNSIEVDDPFCLASIRDKCPYGAVCSEEAINDLQKCFLAVDATPEVFLFKDYDAINKQMKVSYTNVNVARTKLKRITIGMYDGKPFSAWDLYLQNTKRFTVEGLSFYDENPRVFSYFRGYDYKILPQVQKELINPFLEHVRLVIADGNEEVYKYILVWIAAILQGPNFKTGTALVILGNQGSGKNEFFTNIISKLMARYANENVTSIESIVGKFNAALENKKLLVLNELQSIDVNKYLNSDALKSVITDRRININQKNEPERVSENVANLIFVSNNAVPLKIDSCDRRYMVTRTSNKHCKDFDYFSHLNSTFTQDFYENLFTFFMTINIKDFNLRNIPSTEAKEVIKEASMSTYEIYVRDNFDVIKNITGPDLYAHYERFAKANNYQMCTSRTFIANMSQYTGPAKSKRIDGDVKKVYNLIPEVYEKYKKMRDDLENAIVEEEDVDMTDTI